MKRIPTIPKWITKLSRPRLEAYAASVTALNKIDYKSCKKLRGELAEYQADYDHMIGILTRAYVSADNRGEPMVGRDRNWEKLAREFISDRFRKLKK